MGYFFLRPEAIDAANRLQAFMERGEEGGIAAYYNYSADGEWVKYGFFRSCHLDLLCVRLPLLPARKTTSTQLRDNEQVTPFWFRLSFGPVSVSLRSLFIFSLVPLRSLTLQRYNL